MFSGKGHFSGNPKNFLVGVADFSDQTTKTEATMKWPLKPLQFLLPNTTK